MKKLLIVDDQPAIRNELKEKLTRAGYQVEVAENGKKGLEKINLFCPDCVLTEIVMPEMDGFELIMAIRRQKNKIPIIAMCRRERFGHCDYLVSAIHFGANKVLIKPFHIAELIAVLHKYCWTNDIYESCMNYINLSN